MGIDPRLVVELATILALSTTTVGAAQIRHVEGRIVLAVGVTLLFGVLVGRLFVGE